MAMFKGCAAPLSAFAFDGGIASGSEFPERTLPADAPAAVLPAVPDATLRVDAMRRLPRSMRSSGSTIAAPV